MPRKPIAVFFADSHLDTNTWANRPHLQRDSMLAFEHIVNEACQLGVEAILGAGDLIDVKKPPSEVAAFIRRQLDRLVECGIAFAYIQGQHEMSRGVPWFSAMHDEATHINETLLYLSDAIPPVYGLDWRPANQLRLSIGEIPEEAQIVLMHQVWLEHMGPQRGSEGSFTQLPDCKVYFTGDFHEMRVTRQGNSTIISPGSTNLRKINEPAKKYYFVLYDNNSWEAKLIPTRQRVDFSVRNERQLEKFLSDWSATHDKLQAEAAKLPVELHRALLWLKYDPELPDILPRVEAAIGGEVELFRRELPPSRDDADVVIERAERDRAVENGLIGCLPLVVPQDNEDYGVIRNLLDAEDPSVVIDELRKQRGLVNAT